MSIILNCAFDPIVTGAVPSLGGESGARGTRMGGEVMGSTKDEDGQSIGLNGGPISQSGPAPVLPSGSGNLNPHNFLCFHFHLLFLPWVLVYCSIGEIFNTLMPFNSYDFSL